MEVIVIGPEPSCIRCQTALKRAKEAAQEFSNEVVVKKIAVDSEEARQYGWTESGHVIAEVEGVKHDHEKIQELRSKVEGEGSELKDAQLVNSVMEEIEKEITMIKVTAKKRGYLMTPVVVINGKVKSAGEVPEKEELLKWMEAEFK